MFKLTNYLLPFRGISNRICSSLLGVVLYYNMIRNVVMQSEMFESG